MADWTLQAQLQNNTTLDLATDQHVWWNGTNFGDNIALNQYQDSTHVADSDDSQLDTVSSVHNTKYVDNTHVAIDGNSPTILPVPNNKCGLVFTFTDASAVTTSAAKVYIYDGVEDENPLPNVNFMVAEGTHSTTWVNANGLNNGLFLADQSAATTHNFYIATSISPLTAGLKGGKMKIVLNYV